MLQRTLCVVSFLLCLSSAVSVPDKVADLDVTPKHVTQFVGASVKLKCRDVNKRSLYWMHRPVGSSINSDIYFPGMGFTPKYRTGGRHGVELNDTIGACNLVITNIAEEDAGTYVCRLNKGEKMMEAELTVVASEPKCHSNIRMTDILVENDCDLEPDHIRLSCDIGYRGNIPPVLEWHHSSNPDIVIPGQYSTNDSVAFVTAYMKPTYALDGTKCFCSIKSHHDHQLNRGCATENISVIYFFKSVESRKVDTSHAHHAVNITCSANTNAQCKYRWHGTEMLSKNRIEIVGQTIKLVKQDYTDMRCTADCRIRNHQCRSEPLLLEFTIPQGKNNEDEITFNPFIPLIITICIATLVIFIVCVLGWRFKLFNKQISLFSIRYRVHKKYKSDDEESTLLNEQSTEKEFAEKFIRQNTSILIDLLRLNDKFARSLVNKEVLTNKEYTKLVDRTWLTSSNHESQRTVKELLDTLLPQINSRSKFNSFLATLIEQDSFPLADSPETITKFIKDNHSKLEDLLDTDNGLAELLYSNDVLSELQYGRLNNRTFLPSYQEQNRELLKNMLPSSLTSKIKCRAFFAALIESDQRHVFRFILNSPEDTPIPNDFNTRILTDEETLGIQKNRHSLMNLIDCNARFLDILLAEECILPRHRERIDAQQKISEKNRELLTIIRRRSYADFLIFQRALKRTKQRRIIALLQQRTGSDTSVHAEIVEQPEQGLSARPIKVLDKQISDELTETAASNASLTDSGKVSLTTCRDELLELDQNGIKLNGASPTGSVIVYFSCKTFESVMTFKRMVTSGRMKTILEDMFNCFARSSTRLSLSVSMDEDEYKSSLAQARMTIHSEEDSIKAMKEGLPYFRLIPSEMKDMIFEKYVISRMNAELVSIVERKHSRSGGREGYRYGRYFKGALKIALQTLKSVSYDCFSYTSPSKRKTMLKRFFFKRVYDSRGDLVHLLDCRSVFLDCMVKGNVISSQERTIIEGTGELIHKHQCDDIQPSRCPGMTKEMWLANISLIECLLSRSYSQILKFLKLMEDLHSTHILNYIISNEKLPAFGDDWPLEQKIRARFATHNDFLEETLEIEPVQTELVPRKKYFPAVPENTSAGTSEFSDRAGDEFMDPEFGTAGGSNLLDVLQDNLCLSVADKQYIEEQLTPRTRNAAMLEVLRNGSSECFQTALNYFTTTDQIDVCDCLSGKYYEDIQITARIPLRGEKYGVAGVASFEDKIFIVCGRSKTVHAFSNHGFFEELKEESFRISEMKDPRDMVANKVSNSIFISEWSGNRCVWKIQMPGRQISRWEIEGRPRGLSTTPTDELLVSVLGHNGRFHLDTHRSSDFRRTSSILLPLEIKEVYHAVQSSTGSFIISYETSEGDFLIGEISVDGMEYGWRTFDLQSVKPAHESKWSPVHLSVDEDGKIFLADIDGSRVYLLNSRLTHLHNLLKDKHEIIEPGRLCYVRESQQLIVGQGWPLLGTSPSVTVFNLRP